MPLNNLNPYARFRRWQQAAETSPDAQTGPALTGAHVWVVHFSGRDWEGALDRPAYLCLTLAEAQMLQPAHPRDDWPKELRWGEPLVVWNDEGKAGVMGPEGQLWVLCQLAALRSGLSGKRLLALREPVAPIQEPITPRAYLQFRCDVIDSHTGQRVNPIGTSALLGSLGYQGDFVAVMDEEATQWLLIDPSGTAITGPWARIDYTPNDHFVEQALEDLGADRWSLLDENGTPLLLREPVLQEDPAYHSELDATDKAAQHLNRLWQQRRRSLALSLLGLPPHERVAQYRPTTERDLISLGLWGQRVRCTRPLSSAVLGEGAKPEAYLECHYPVTLSIFNLAAEAPVTFTRADGSTVCIGVPWDGLELVNNESEGLAEGKN